MASTEATRTARLGRALAGLGKLAAMALAALAVAAGLHLRGGLSPVAAGIVGACLLAVLACAQAALARAARAARAVDGLRAAPAPDPSEAETVLAGQSRQLAATIMRMEDLAGRLEDVERHIRATPPPPPRQAESAALAAKAAQVDRLTADVDRLGARLEALRSQGQIEAMERHEKLATELQVLETLVKQLAERMTAEGAERAPGRRPPGRAFADRERQGESPAWLGSAAPPSPALDPLIDESALDAAVLRAVRQSVEANKVDLYLQPIVTLPRRQVRSYEALTRLRDGDGNVLLPKDYLAVAEAAGMMPLIDNVMLFRSVQVLKRLSERSSARGVFCNISIHSLLDPEFFPEFIAFMEQNRHLSDSLFFEFGQRMVDSFGPIEQESLAALSRLGFRFSLDQVIDLDIDFPSLHRMGFRFVKVEADLLRHRSAEAGARIHAADMRAFLERHGLELIVEKIEDERALADLLDFDVRLGQGYLFSEPRPVRPEVFDAADASVAA